MQAPPALVVGADTGRGRGAAEVRFQLARGIELSRPEYILAAGVKPKQFSQLFAQRPQGLPPASRAARARPPATPPPTRPPLKKNVPYKVSKRLVELFQELGTTSWSSVRWRAVVQHTGNRAGLLLWAISDGRAPRPPKAAHPERPRDRPEEMRAARRQNEPLRELLRFAISEDYFLLREKLGTAIAKAAAA